ncbi:MAG: class I SAM-dependent methyltransferase [Aequorivita sp.]
MNNSAEKYLTTKDYLVSGEAFELIYDSQFEMLKTIPQPPVEKLADYYESLDYISHTDRDRGMFATLYQLVKKWSIKKKLRLITRENNGTGSLLDIGAGTGDFLVAAKEGGWEVFGMEPNTNALKLASEKGLVLKSSLDQFKNRQFDVITLWHVLEHVPNLGETILELSSLVKPNGTLIIAVPNFKSYDALHYGKYWAAFDTPRHLWHFSRKSLMLLFDDHFQLKKTLPMFFDSFYVSLLSEKYKTGRQSSIKGIWIGFISNLKGRRSKEYSSHIYCFKRNQRL